MRGNPLFCYINPKIGKQFRRKFLFINVFNVNRMCFKLNFPIFTQFLVVLCKKIIENITVHENGCSHILFWCIETGAWIHFRRKLFLLNDLILIRIFWLMKLFCISTNFTVEINSGRGSELYWVFCTTAWILFRRKWLCFNDLTPNQIFLLLKFKWSNILTLKGNRNRHTSKKWAW